MDKEKQMVIDYLENLQIDIDVNGAFGEFQKEYNAIDKVLEFLRS